MIPVVAQVAAADRMHKANEVSIEYFGFELGSLRQRTERTLSRVACDRALEHVNLDFWSLPTTGPERGDDGAEWVVEARHGKLYHVVERWSGGALKPIGIGFFTLAKISIPPDELY